MINQLSKRNNLRVHLVGCLFLLSLATYGQGSVSLSFPYDNCIDTKQAGTYSVNGSYNGKPIYQKGTDSKIQWTGSRWELLSKNWQGNFYLTHYNNSNTNKLPCGNWAAQYGCALPSISGDCVSPPTSNDIPGVSVDEGAADVIINLQSYFNDAQDGSAGLTYTKQSTDGTFFSATIDGSNQLKIDFAETGSGQSTVTIRATDTDGAFVEESFSVKAVAPVEGSIIIDFEGLGFSNWSDYGSGVYIEDNLKITYPTMNWYESQNGEGGTDGLMADGWENTVTDIVVETLDGSEVDFISFYFSSTWGMELNSVKGYKDGALTGTQSTGLSGSITLSNAIFDEVDKIVITSSWGFYEDVFDNFWYLPLASSAAPSVTTSAVSSVTAAGATLSGEVTSDGGASITERGFVYALTSDDLTPTVAEVNGTTVLKQTSIGTTGAFSESVSGLSASSDYSYVAYATNSAGTTEGSVEIFTTIAEDDIKPTAEITTNEPDPTNNPAITFTIAFSEEIQGFSKEDLVIGNGTVTFFTTSTPVHIANLGTGMGGSASDQFNSPMDVAIGADGKIYVVDLQNHRVQVFNADHSYFGTIGSGTAGSGNDQFHRPSGVDVAADGKIYVADYVNHRIQIFNADLSYTGTIGTGSVGSGNNQFNAPIDVWTGADGKIYVSDYYNHRIQVFNADLSYAATLGMGVSGSENNQFNFPSGGFTSADGKIYIADFSNNRIQIFNSDFTFAGTLGTGARGSGNDQFYAPHGVIVDSEGMIFIADFGNHRIQMFNADHTYAGTIGGYGSANSQFNYPTNLSIDADGMLYVTDRSNHRVQVFEKNNDYEVTVAPDADGVVTVDLPAGAVTDMADNGNEAATQFSITHDGTAPTVTIASSESGYTNTSPIPLTILYSEEVNGFSAEDIYVSGGSITSLITSDSTSFTAELTPSAEGTITVDIYGPEVSDNAGNHNPAVSQFSITYQTPLTLVYNTTLSDGTGIDLPLGTAGTVNVTVDWGDGLSDTYTATGIKTHTYASEGIYTVKVYGSLDHFGYGPNHVSSINNDKLTDIIDFGNLGITDLSGGARGASNLTAVPADLPANVTDLRNMFRDASSFTQDLNGWDVSQVQQMSAMFWGAGNFNGNISSWNTGAVTSMNSIFLSAGSFNQDISGWNTGQVTDMGQMFLGASSFNQNIGGWDVSQVTNMMSMFLGVSNFNHDLSNWNTGNVKYMQNMFLGAGSFNQDLNTWNVSKVENMSRMFENTAIDQKFDGWDVSNVSNMTGMFKNRTLSSANYDATLVGWSKLALQNGVTFDAGSSEYSPGTAETARQKIIEDFGWTFIDGGLNVPRVTLSQLETTFDEKDGTNTLKVTLSETYASNVTVTLGIKPSSIATLNTDFTLSSATVEVPIGEITGSVTLTGVDDDTNEPSESVIVEIVSVANGVEDGTQEVTSTINDDEITAASAGSDEDVCGTSTTLAANSAEAGFNESGSWNIISGAGGSVTTPASNTSTFSGTPGITYTLRWTISDGVAEDSYDDVTITFFDNPTVAAAGPDQDVEGAIFTTTLEANSASGFQETGSWTEQSGDGKGIFTDLNDPATAFSGTAGVTYTLRWTISNGVCADSSDDVNVMFTNTAGFTVAESDNESKVDETGSTDQFTVVLDAEPASDVTLSVTSSDEGEVITDVATLTFTSFNWNTPQTITLSGVDDIRVDGDVLTNITVSVVDDQTADAYDAVPDKVIEVTNGDDDTAALTMADVSGNEDDGAITVTATLDNAVDGGFTIDVSTTDGTATAGSDYTVVSNETLTFAGTAGEIQAFTVTPTVDSKVESTETLAVRMSNLGGTALNVSATDEAIVTIINDDHAPAFTSAVAVEVLENLQSVQDVAAMDADAGETVTYSITGGADESQFSVNGATGALSFVDVPDYENAADADKNNVYDVQVTASDGTNSTDQIIAVTVKDVNDNSPVFTSPNTAAVTENTTAVFTVTATDEDAGTSISFSLIGGDDQSKFNINSSTGALTFSSAPDHEEAVDANGENDYLVTVRASDGTNHTDQSITVSVQDVNDNSPVITSENKASVEENNTAVKIVIATDADATSIVTYSITGGLDQGLFTINNTSGELTFVSAPDAEDASDSDKNNEYVVEVTATDGVNSDVQSIIITVNDVDDNAPVISGTFTGEVTEGFSEEVVTVAGTISISDNDINDTPVFTVIDGVAGDNKYGTFSLSGTTWTYTLDHAAVEHLDAVDQVIDGLDLMASDGSSQRIAITITGKDPDNDRDDISDYVDTDDDNDGTVDTEDAFPLDPSEDTDTDSDGTGNNADTDDDNDGTLDAEDAFPLDPSEDTDTDGDGTGNNADTDDDNDGTADNKDAFPLDPAEDTDNDSDGIGNNADDDDDNDGAEDSEDAFPLDPAEDTDTDGDGIGNNADTDDDNDGTPDVDDAFPLDPNEDTDTDGDGIGNNADDNDDNDPYLDVDDEFPLIPSGSSDMDNDGIADSDEGLEDTDNDGIPNYLDDDSDDDEIADADEGVEDCDLDGIPDYLDPYSCQDLMTRKILTANNDGYNDQFVIQGIDKFPNNRVIIYNRWGATVWEIENYDNEDAERSFMGISNKIGSREKLPGGTYFYVIIREGEKVQKGYFVLN